MLEEDARGVADAIPAPSQTSQSGGRRFAGSGAALVCAAVLLVLFPIIPVLYFLGVVGGNRLQAPEASAADDPAALAAPPHQTPRQPNPNVEAATVRIRRMLEDSRSAAAESAALASSRHDERLEPWDDYEIRRQIERSGRILAGRKQSISYDIDVLPRGDVLPTRDQLAQIAFGLRSDMHQQTLIYFYLPGMDHTKGAWATAHHLPGAGFEVRFNPQYLKGRWSPR